MIRCEATPARPLGLVLIEPSVLGNSVTNVDPLRGPWMLAVSELIVDLNEVTSIGKAVKDCCGPCGKRVLNS